MHLYWLGGGGGGEVKSLYGFPAELTKSITDTQLKDYPGGLSGPSLAYKCHHRMLVQASHGNPSPSMACTFSGLFADCALSE